MKNQLHYFSLLAGSLILLFSCTGSSEKIAGGSSSATSQALPVDAVVIKKEGLSNEITFAGSVLPGKEVMITSELSKKITYINFKDGAFVHQGQLLYKLDDSDIKARQKKIQSELNLAEITERRMKELLKKESVKQEEYDIALSRLTSLKAEEDLIISEMQKTNIVAPFSGKVGITKVHTGAFVTPGMELVALQEQGQLRVQFSVPENYSNLVKEGKSIKFKISNDTGSYIAKIHAYEPGLSNHNRSLLVQAFTPNTNGLLKPGMSAIVYFETMPEGTQGVLVPTISLLPAEKGYAVYTVKNGLAKTTPVVIENRDENHAVISSGLIDGDTLIISNLLKIYEGLPVQVVSVNQ